MNPTELNLSDLVELQHIALSVPYLLNRHRSRSALLGGHLSRLRGRGMEFADVRAYQPGDDIRHMDWRLTARTGEPHTKLYQEERERPVYIVVDFSSSMHFATQGRLKSVMAAQIAGIIGWIGMAAGDRIGGLIRTSENILQIKPKPRKAGMMTWLQSLVSMHQIPLKSHSPPWSEVLDHLLHIVRPGSCLVFVSDWMNVSSGDLPRWNSLAHHHDLMGFIVSDPIEIKMPPPGRYPIHNGEQIAWLELEHPHERAHYQAYFDHQRAQAEDLLQRIPMPFLRCMTTDDLNVTLPLYLRGQLPEWRYAG